MRNRKEIRAKKSKHGNAFTQIVIENTLVCDLSQEALNYYKAFVNKAAKEQKDRASFIRAQIGYFTNRGIDFYQASELGTILLVFRLGNTTEWITAVAGSSEFYRNTFPHQINMRMLCWYQDTIEAVVNGPVSPPTQNEPEDNL